MPFSPPLRPWLGTCPECGGGSVYRESTPGRIVGACCAGRGRWWAGEIGEEKVTVFIGSSSDGTITATSDFPVGSDS